MRVFILYFFSSFMFYSCYEYEECYTYEKEKPITIVGSGQSNMLGANTGGDMTTNDLIKVWDKDLKIWKKADLYQKPFSSANNIAFSFAKKYVEEKNKEVRIILNAQNWKPINQWTSAVVPTMWNDLVSQIEESGVETIDVFLWHQGEANYRSTTVEEYADEFNLLLQKLNNELWFNESETPFICGKLTRTYSKMNELYDNINEWVSDKNVKVIDMQGIEGNPEDIVPYLHFTGEELEILGKERYWYKYKELQ